MKCPDGRSERWGRSLASRRASTASQWHRMSRRGSSARHDPSWEQATVSPRATVVSCVSAIGCHDDEAG